jgi:ribose transport system ATP-binding protein
MVSSELTELMALCDRILVMSAGSVVAEFLPGQWSQEKITHAAFSGHSTAWKTGKVHLLLKSRQTQAR